jgi:acyl carrier protein
MLKEAAIAERASETSGFESFSSVQQTSATEAESMEDVVLRVIARHVDGLTVTPESNLKYDLNLDSLTMMEICIEIEGALNILIAESMGAIETVNDILTVIESVNSGGAKKSEVDYNIEDYPLKKTKLHMMNLRRYMFYSRFFWKCEIVGIENVPLNKNYILCSNHQSNLDGLWIWAAIGEKRADLTKICCLAKHELIQKKVARTGLTWLGGIPVDRSGNSVPAMKRCRDCLKDGYNVLIHPEGTRTLDGKMQEFKGGAARLAIDADAPIIPVRIDGAWDIFPPHRKLPKTFRFGRRYPVRISFGKPISPAGKSVDELTSELYHEVEKLGNKN